jgi:hypothetical protein
MSASSAAEVPILQLSLRHFSLIFSLRERNRVASAGKRCVIAMCTNRDGFKIAKQSWQELHWGKPGTANLPIGVLPRANQEIGGPRKHTIL